MGPAAAIIIICSSTGYIALKSLFFVLPKAPFISWGRGRGSLRACVLPGGYVALGGGWRQASGSVRR